MKSVRAYYVLLPRGFYCNFFLCIASGGPPLGVAHMDWTDNPHGIPVFDRAERFKEMEQFGPSKLCTMVRHT